MKQDLDYVMRIRQEDRQAVLDWIARNPAIAEKMAGFPTDKLRSILRAADRARKDATFRNKVRTETNAATGRNVSKGQAVDMMWLSWAAAQLELEKRGA